MGFGDATSGSPAKQENGDVKGWAKHLRRRGHGLLLEGYIGYSFLKEV